MKFSVPYSKPSNTTYNFTVQTSSLGSELNPVDNSEVVELGAKVDACVHVEADVSRSFVSVVANNDILKVNLQFS